MVNCLLAKKQLVSEFESWIVTRHQVSFSSTNFDGNASLRQWPLGIASDKTLRVTLSKFADTEDRNLW